MGDRDVEPLHDELALAGWGLVFVRPDTEAAYRAWHARQAMPFLRITYVATLVIVLPAALFIGHAFPAGFGVVAQWILLILAPLLLAGLAGTYRPAMARWMGPMGVFNNALCGCSFVAMAFYALHRPDLAMGATVMAAFYAFTTLRLHLGQAVLAALPYFALDEVLTARLSPGDLAFYSCMLAVALGTGVIVAATMNRTLRSSYRQERIIEAQRTIIERERRRADELLYNVLPAAIAERLKRDPKRIAEHFDQVTVLFADIAGFTPLSAEMSPHDLVAALDEVFK